MIQNRAAAKERTPMLIPLNCPVCDTRMPGWFTNDTNGGKWIRGLSCDDRDCGASFDARMTIHRDHTVTIETRQTEED